MTYDACTFDWITTTILRIQLDSKNHTYRIETKVGRFDSGLLALIVTVRITIRRIPPVVIRVYLHLSTQLPIRINLQ